MIEAAGLNVAQALSGRNDRVACVQGPDTGYATVNRRLEPVLHCCVLADPDALAQVILNLIDNACKYAASGKRLDISISGSAEHQLGHANDFATHIRKRGEDEASRSRTAEIRIADRGPTIPVKHAKRIFERFYRADDSLTAATGGSGLGLAIARQLMRGMGGDLRWDPREGGGNVFVVSLPPDNPRHPPTPLEHPS
jgi:signal transduction histidine kinase